MAPGDDPTRVVRRRVAPDLLLGVGAADLRRLARGHWLIPVERTTTPFDVFALTRNATQNIKELNTSELNKLITDFADITQGKQQSVADLVQGLDKVSTAIASRDAELSQLLDRADTLSTTLAEKDQTLVALIDQSKKILDLLANRRDELARALGAGSDAVTQLSEIIKQCRNIGVSAVRGRLAN